MTQTTTNKIHSADFHPSSPGPHERAKAALAVSPFHELRYLAVAPRDGAICLTGQVTCFYHKQLAQEIVRTVCDDAEICNSIEVIPSYDDDGR